jgi:hypothetical protein
MRILFLTSDDTVKGLTSDDGFEIGRFSLADTVGLVLLTAALGVIAALLYLVARPFVISLGPAVTPVMAVFYGVIGGALMVHTDGVDFTRLEPAALAIAMFVALCASFWRGRGPFRQPGGGRRRVCSNAALAVRRPSAAPAGVPTVPDRRRRRRRR